MKSLVRNTRHLKLPLIEGEHSMIEFDIDSLDGLKQSFRSIVKKMLRGIKCTGIAYFTIHGKKLEKKETLRRGGPHTDGNYEPVEMDFRPGGGGGNGWKVGEDGPAVSTALHKRQYYKETGGIILVSNYKACRGWVGEFYGLPSVGGDCSHIELDNKPFLLKADEVYYGNNHFIHESIPVCDSVHRVFARITLPEDHVYEN